MAKFSYTPRGVCSAQIDFEIDDGKVHNIHFTRGCSGNTQGVARLAEGRDAMALGRMDMYLFPFYENDVKKGRAHAGICRTALWRAHF